MACIASSHTSTHVVTQQNGEQEAQRSSTLAEKLTSREVLPPNGGLSAWMQVATSFCIFFSTGEIISITAYIKPTIPPGFRSPHHLSYRGWDPYKQFFFSS
ncbi:hypothetical protein HO173_004261 [Letharia columbiana]|uniref:Uncharacterized protein n=1 Tax=Letharia columbiana TaxID=112416 RepID=A0A8H6FYU9_9LECA|nr:uncharacterized protein HO173_004261 [Letharia columbiana]KAF6237371.1 hypothetical protein HO173_004261 [Letharia columbiana]